MATATVAEELKGKTREELVEACFQVHLEVKILKAQKTGEQPPQRLAFATEKFKGKFEKKAREVIIRMYLQACKEIDDMKKEEDSPPQKKQKREAMQPDLGHVIGDIVNACLVPRPDVLLDLERARMAKEDLLAFHKRKADDEAEAEQVAWMFRQQPF